MSLGDCWNIRRVVRGLGGAVVSLVAIAASATAAHAATIDTTRPSTPLHLRVAKTTETKIKLAWDPSTDNVAVDHYDVYRDGNYVGKALPSSLPTYTDGGLWPQSTHTYYVFAVDGALNRSASTPLLTAWTIADTTAPSAPTNLVGQFYASTPSVSLKWTGSTDNVKVVRYDIYRNLMRIGSSANLATTYKDSAPPLNVKLSYIVLAVDEFGNSSLSSNAATIITDTLRPTTPSSVRVTSTGKTSVSLAWLASTDNFGVAKYDVLRNGVVIASQSWVLGTTFYDGTALSGQQYTYAIVAKDATGNASLASTSIGARTLL